MRGAQTDGVGNDTRVERRRGVAEAWKDEQRRSARCAETHEFGQWEVEERSSWRTGAGACEAGAVASVHAGSGAERASQEISSKAILFPRALIIIKII